MERRGFLGALGALMAAVAVPVRALAGQRLPVLYGDGVADDTAAFQAWIDGQPVLHRGAVMLRDKLPPNLKINTSGRMIYWGGSKQAFTNADYPMRVIDMNGSQLYWGECWITDIRGPQPLGAKV